MHGNRFDALTKTWGMTRGTDSTSRRGVLSLLSALAIGGRLAPQQAAVAQEVGACLATTCLTHVCTRRWQRPGRLEFFL